MKKLLLALAALLCFAGCEIYNGDEQNQDAVEVMRTVLDAYTSGCYITDVTNFGNGSRFSFSNGASVTLQKQSTNSGENSEVTVTSFTVGENDVTFTLSTGEELVIPLQSKLVVQFDTADIVRIAPNSTLDIHYTVESILDDISVDIVTMGDIAAEVVDSGVLSGTIRITSGETISEDAKIVVFVSHSKKMIKRELKVQQGIGGEQKPFFDLAERSATVVATGGNITVAVSTNVEYTYDISADWIKEVGTAVDNVHTFEVQPNTETQSRTTTIVFCGNEQCIPFTVTQEAAKGEDMLDVDTKSLQIEAAGTGLVPIVVNVTSNLQWGVSSSESWCQVAPASGEGNGSFAVVVAVNESAESRIANITVASADGKLSRTISVIQSPAASGSEDKSWTNAEFYHRPVAMRFTADWCGYCPMMATAFAAAQSQMSGRLEVLSAHASGGLYTDPSATLATYHGITGFPTGVIDGAVTVFNTGVAAVTSTVLQTIASREEQYKTLTGASWKSAAVAGQAGIDLDLYIKKAGSYKVTVLLVEDNIIGYQSDYTNGNTDSYCHNGVIRAAFTDALGNEFTVAEDNQVQKFSFATAIPTVCNSANLRVVVYVQAADASATYYIDNSATAKLGEEKSLALNSDSWGGGNEGITPGDDIVLK